MPPLFVDGVEINSVFVDGIEQNSVWADGVEVFSSKIVVFDDFDDVIGTSIEDHNANTGQDWLPGQFDGGSAIQNALGGLGMGIFVNGNASTYIVPQITQLESWYAKVGMSTLKNSGLVIAGEIFAGYSVFTTGAVSTYARYLLTGQIGIVNNADVLGEVSVPNAGPLEFELEMWVDGNEMQAGVTINGTRTLSGKVTVTGAFNNPLETGGAYVTESSLGGNDSQPNIWEYYLEEFAPGTVPFP